MNHRGGLSLASSGQEPAPGLTYPGPGIPGDPAFGRSSHNPLLLAARPLLNLMVQIRTGKQAINPVLLRERLISAIRRFQDQAQALSTPVETIVGARYCLCTALDESAALTSWGGDGIWSAHSLLVIFHNETWGGEKFFQLLARLIQDPGRHWPLIELQFHCLALGFEGRYRIIDNGQAQLEGLKLRLRKLLAAGAGGQGDALAGHWLDPQGRASATLRRWVPLWSWLVLALILTAGVYVGLLLLLNARLDAGYVAVNSIHLPALDILAAPAQRDLHLKELLADDIRGGALSVEDAADHHVITLHGDGLFDSGRADLRPAYRAVLARVAAALDRVPGRIVLVGHTDNQPIHTASYPSNQTLSLARARSVADFLHDTALGAHRDIQVQGQGDTHPLTSNDTASGRALNRRVEMVLFPGAAASPSPWTR